MPQYRRGNMVVYAHRVGHHAYQYDGWLLEQHWKRRLTITWWHAFGFHGNPVCRGGLLIMVHDGNEMFNKEPIGSYDRANLGDWVVEDETGTLMKMSHEEFGKLDFEELRTPDYNPHHLS